MRDDGLLADSTLRNDRGARFLDVIAEDDAEFIMDADGVFADPAYTPLLPLLLLLLLLPPYPDMLCQWME